MKPEEDPRVTDLRRYRKQREEAARRRQPAPKPPRREGFLGSNPRAGLILLAVILVLLALYALPRFL